MMPSKQRQISSSQNLTMTKRRYSKNISSTLYSSESFRPLATSTPYDIPSSSSSRSFIPDSPQQQRALLTPPVCCSTPKQTRRRPTIPKFPIVISQRRLQFTNHSSSEPKRMTIKTVKIWLL